MSTGAARSSASRLAIKEVTSSTWKDFERLFESKGAPSYCWCMVWRSSAEEAKHNDNAHRKKGMRQRVHDGTPVGLLGYLEDEPVAWCSIAPRVTFPRLVKNAQPEDRVWSITCFFVVRPHRRAGITRKLIAAAIAQARKQGARLVEAYPVDEDSPSYRFMGFVPVFEQAGFIEIGTQGTRRHVMHKAIRASRAGRTAQTGKASKAGKADKPLKRSRASRPAG